MEMLEGLVEVVLARMATSAKNLTVESMRPMSLLWWSSWDSARHNANVNDASDNTGYIQERKKERENDTMPWWFRYSNTGYIQERERMHNHTHFSIVIVIISYSYSICPRTTLSWDCWVIGPTVNSKQLQKNKQSVFQKVLCCVLGQVKVFNVTTLLQKWKGQNRVHPLRSNISTHGNPPPGIPYFQLQEELVDNVTGGSTHAAGT